MKEEVYLTTLQMMCTYGFIKLVLSMWAVGTLIALPIIYFLHYTKEE